MTRRATRWGAIWLVVGVFAAVAAVGVGVLVYTLTRPQTPDIAARDYLDALAAGDGERALTFVDVPDDDLDRAAALVGATELLSEPEVVGFGYPANTDTAGAAVRFTLAGERWEANLSLRPVDGGWRIAVGGLSAVEVATDLGQAVTIGEATVPVGLVELLPAVYRVNAAPASVTEGETSVTALPGGVTSAPTPIAAASVDAQLSAAAADLAQDELDAYADTCTRPAAAVPEACGLLVPWPAQLRTLDSVAFRIERYPSLVLSADGRSFDAAGGLVVATATGTDDAGATASVTYRDDAWALRGIVRVSADGLALGVR